ncbi:hypothetical protein Q5424_02790 [Conexibacter sp. JD483]|uniref:hypothetical protein n=1 Tax=unclassified Conexibacter TaxID=2627773 RepID=UPI00271C8F3C|nr:MULTISPECIES: hypothetical protein [unclassified Conexibacter]MDO8185032.1 hypothetical protein [Conexibacter sp. CPCC 205706]MDO8196742.1 hypothetical protein [Conexibacter sp. CPCC 205762]MDR9367990.1 hypothetical protein [Conexibacter sp. JD483]
MRSTPLSRAALAGAASLLLAAGLFAGCGSDDSSSTSASSTPATTATVSLADAAQAYMPIDAEIRAIGGDIATTVNDAPNQTDDALAEQFGGLTDRTEAAVGRLEALEVPADLSTALDNLREALQTGADDLRDIAAAARAHDAQAAREATQRLISDSAGIREGRAEVNRALRSAGS